MGCEGEDVCMYEEIRRWKAMKTTKVMRKRGMYEC